VNDAGGLSNHEATAPHATSATPIARRTLRVALGEYDTGWHDPEASLVRAEAVIERAARSSVRLVVLPEMCTTGFTMDSSRWAEPLGGWAGSRLAAAAAKHDVWIIAGLAARDREGLPAFNAAAVFSPWGELHAVYRKQRLFALGREDDSYSPGAGPLIVDIDGVRVSPFVCYDVRFPELFRAVARDVDVMVVIANWPIERRAHWDLLVRARAIENLCYVVGVNRRGVAGGHEYDGGSVIIGPWGNVLASAAGGATDAPPIGDLDPAFVKSMRDRYPFLRDM
jgi:omega-amidase